MKTKNLRRLLFLLFAIAGARPAAAQFTTVTGTVTDANGIPYAGATLKAQLQLAGGGTTGQATVTVSNAGQCTSSGFGSAPCKIPIQGTNGPITLDPTGSFTLTLPDNALVLPASTQWLFTVNMSPGIPPPGGKGPQTFTSAITITGTSQSVSATLSGAAPTLGFSGGSSVTTAFVNPVTSGLIGQYNLLETSGATIADTSGQGNTGTFGCTGGSSPTFTGTPAKGLVFAGANCVMLPAALNAAQTIMIFATHATSSNAGFSPGECLIAGNGNGVPNVGADPLCLTALASYNTPVGVERLFSLVNGSTGLGSTSINIFSGSGTLGIVMGLSGNSTVDQFYENGLQTVDTTNRGAIGGTQTTGAYCLGGCGAGQGNVASGFFAGNIYMAVLYNRQLSAAEMASVNGWMQDTMNVRGVPTLLADTAIGDLVFIDGDSLSVGALSGVNWTSFLTLTGTPFYIMDDGFAGYGTCDLTQTQFSINPVFRTTSATRQAAVVWIGANNIGGARSCPPNTTTSELGQLVQICNIRRTVGWKCLPMTVISHTGGGVDAVKNQWNTFLRQTWSTWADGLIDIAANPSLGADGAFANTTFFNGDGIHPSAFSYQTIVAPLVQHGINRLYGNTPTSGTAATYRVGGTATPRAVQGTTNSGSCAGNQNASPTATCAFTNNTAAGSLAELNIIWFNAVTITGVTDAQGNTWTAASAKFTFGSFPYNQQVWSAPNIIGGTTDLITITFSGAAVHVWPTIAEFAGVLTVAPVDVASTGAQSTGTLTATTTAATTTVTGDLLVGNFGNDANPATTFYSSANFTLLAQGSATATTWTLAGAPGAYTATATHGVSVGWGAQLVAFKPGLIPATTSLFDVDVYAYCDPGGGSITLQLPDAIGLTGQTVTIKNIQSAGANTCTIAGINAETIDGAASVVIANKATIVLQSKLVSASAGGANWVQLQNN
jgi:hypothetical protein